MTCPMTESHLLHHLLDASAGRSSLLPALTDGASTLDYAQLSSLVDRFSSGVRALGLARMDRVGIYLEKRFETVVASFGATAAGGVFVPINPLLKAEQVVFIAVDCNLRVLVTSPERLALLLPLLDGCPDLRHVVLTAAMAPVPALPLPSLPVARRSESPRI